MEDFNTFHVIGTVKNLVAPKDEKSSSRGYLTLNMRTDDYNSALFVIFYPVYKKIGSQIESAVATEARIGLQGKLSSYRNDDGKWVNSNVITGLYSGRGTTNSSSDKPIITKHIEEPPAVYQHTNQRGEDILIVYEKFVERHLRNNDGWFTPMECAFLRNVDNDRETNYSHISPEDLAKFESIAYRTEAAPVPKEQRRKAR